MSGVRGTIEKHRKAIGIAMVASGAAIVGSLALSLKAAAAEEAGIERLSVAMTNVGLSYDDAKESLEGWINAQQQATAFADSDMRDALASMIRMTGDLAEAQDYLTLAMDVAVGTNKDLASASQLVQYAMGGNWGMVERYIPALKSVENEEEKWAELRRLFAGQAEAYGQTLAGQMDLLKNNVGDVVEALGAALLPVATSLLETIMPIIESMKEWIAEHPTLTKVIVIASGVLGVLLTTLGGLLLLMPSITAAMAAFGITLHLSLGPIGLVILGVTALIAAGIALWKNWDKVVHFFKIAWSEIKIFVLTAIEKILGALAKFTSWIPILGEKVQEAHDAISNMVDAEKVKRDLSITNRELEINKGILEDTTVAVDDLTKAEIAYREELEEQQKVLLEQQEIYENRLEQIEALRDELEYERSEAGKLRITTDDVTKALISQGWTSERIANLWEDYGDELDNVNTYLEVTGLLAKEVNAILEDQEEAVDGVRKAYEGLGVTPATGGVWGVGEGAPSGMTLPQYEAAARSIRAASPGMSATESFRQARIESNKMAEGGIAMRPMLATIAENKPEAVIPLEKLSGMVGGIGGRVVNIILELDGRILAKAIEIPLVDDIRLRTGLRI